MRRTSLPILKSSFTFGDIGGLGIIGYRFFFCFFMNKPQKSTCPLVCWSEKNVKTYCILNFCWNCCRTPVSWRTKSRMRQNRHKVPGARSTNRLRKGEKKYATVLNILPVDRSCSMGYTRPRLTKSSQPAGVQNQWEQLVYRKFTLRNWEVE